MVESSNRCPGCRQEFKPDDITELLPYPGKKGPKLMWHLRCHQDVYFQDLRNQEAAVAEALRNKYGELP